MLASVFQAGNKYNSNGVCMRCALPWMGPDEDVSGFSDLSSSCTPRPCLPRFHMLVHACFEVRLG